MANRTYYTPSISLPEEVRFADCKPIVYTTDEQLAGAYLVQNYIPRSAWSWFDKGPFPPPFLLESTLENNTAYYTIYFNGFEGGQCPTFLCNLQCTTQDVVLSTNGNPSFTGSYCINGERPIYNFSIDFSSTSNRENNPLNLSFTFTDSLSNTYVSDFQSVSYIVPIKPNTAFVDNGDSTYSAYVGIVKKTRTFNDINYVKKFKIQKAVGTTKNIIDTIVGPEQVLSSTYNLHNNIFIDNNVTAGSVISYRIQFENEYGETTQWSEWVTIT